MLKQDAPGSRYSPGVTDVEALYDHRFSDAERARKDRLWEVLCDRFLQRYVRPEDTVLDVACGLGEFSRHIRAARRIAVDLNPSARRLLPEAVEFHAGPAHDLSFLADGTVDLAFSSNFLEHLSDKAAIDVVLREVRRVLKPGGRYVVIQPNVRYAYREYWDFYDHHTALSHLSCAEGFALAGFEVEEVIGRFLPFTTKTRVPSHPALLRLYLALPSLWRLFGKQFLLVGRKPT
jgi:ubiquinone/menaquinone biosynthesis C-methylase UbiE